MTRALLAARAWNSLELSASQRMLVANVFILSIFQYFLAFTTTPAAATMSIRRQLIILIFRIFMIPCRALTYLKSLGIRSELPDFEWRSHAIQLRVAFETGKLSKTPQRDVCYQIRAGDQALPTISYIWKRAHATFYERTGKTIPKLFDEILRERPLVWANCVSYAKKRLQRRIHDLIRPPVTSITKYPKDRLQRYRDDTPVGELFNRMWTALNPMQAYRVEERDRFGALRFFSNGWFSDRRFQ